MRFSGVDNRTGFYELLDVIRSSSSGARNSVGKIVQLDEAPRIGTQFVADRIQSANQIEIDIFMFDEVLNHFVEISITSGEEQLTPLAVIERSHQVKSHPDVNWLLLDQFVLLTGLRVRDGSASPALRPIELTALQPVKFDS